MIADPPAANIGYPLPANAADAVTITHDHGDHNNAAGVRGSFTLVDGRPVRERTEMPAAGLPFVLIPGFHDNQNGAQRGSNTIIRWTQSGLRFAHFGDFGQDLANEAQLPDLQELDVIFLPAGGFFTIDAQRAAAVVNQLRPRVAILMHFRTALGGPAQLATFPALVGPFPEIVYKPSSVTVSRAALPASTEVWLMEVSADGAVVNAASFAAGTPVAPGSLASLFGTFTGAQTAAASQLPLSRRLGETEVLVGGNAVPLLFTSPGQINFQVPSLLAPGLAAMEVRVGGQRVGRASMTVTPVAPGLFAVLNQDSRLNAPGTPARRGQTLQIYATGQGAVAPEVEDGTAAPSSPLAITAAAPEVLVGGRPAAVQFSGLAPGFVGVWQINAVIPADTPVGTAVPLVVTQGLSSNTVAVAVE